jgi:2',3'-cyclic-nucleotide 2'-phosphodiesterase/3'-nucleotidase
MRLFRRTVSTTAVAALGLALALPASAAVAAPGDIQLTLMATTDTHGHVDNWDYFANAPYPATGTLGLSRVATIVDQARTAKGADSVVVLDNGDAIQGTPLTYYYGLGDGAAGVLANQTTHPMAQAFNAIGYDAQAVGNHEYNYGLDMLSAYEDDLDAPLLGANVIEFASGQPYHDPYTIIERVIDGQTVTVGVLGLVTPGVRIWDKQFVDGVLEFEDMVTAAKRWVPEVAAQADVVVVLAHTGAGTVPDVGYDPAALNEDVAANIARQVPGIDVLVAGHSHADLPTTVYTNVAGEKVLVTQPKFWAQSVSEVTLTLTPDVTGGLDVTWPGEPSAVARYTPGVAENTAFAAELADEVETAVDYVNTPVARSVTALPAATSRYEDTAIIDFINQVQTETVESGLEGTPSAGIPVVSQASPFSRTALFPEGQVTIRDIAGLYIYENTLRGVQLTGAQLREYLEYSARYFTQVAEGAAFDPATGTNAKYPDRPEGVPDYNYDAISGVDYVIDISKPVGSRIVSLTHTDGSPVAADEPFVLAVNNYRQSGGGAFPNVAAAPVVYDERLEIRQALIDWASDRGVIDPADFFDQNWRLTSSALAGAPAPGGGTPAPGAGAPAAGGPTAAIPAARPTATTPSAPRAGTRALAATGSDSAAPALALGTLLLVGGVGTWLVARRRAAASAR